MRRNVAVVAVTGLVDGVGLMLALVGIARALGPAAYGQFAAAYALVMLAAVITEGGLAAAVTRGIARDRQTAGSYVGRALALRFVLAAITWIASVIVALAVFGDDRVRSVAVLGGYAAFVSLSQLGDAVFRAHERMGLTLRGVATERATLIVALVALSLRGPSLDGVGAAFVLSGAARLAVVAVPSIRLAGSPALRIDLGAWTRLMREALPLGMTAAMASVSWRIDVLMLSVLVPGSFAVVGTYNAAYTVFSAAMLGAGAITITVYPAVSRLHARAPAAVRGLCRRAVGWLMVIGLLATAAVFVAAPWIVAAIYGERFEASAAVLRVLAWALVAASVGIFTRTVLPAIDRDWHAGAIMGVGALANVGLNFLLIPRFAGLGAAWATVGSETLTAILGGTVLVRHLGKPALDADRVGRGDSQPEQGPLGAAHRL